MFISSKRLSVFLCPFYCILERFFAMASSTACNCIRSSSRLDIAPFRFDALPPPVEALEGGGFAPDDGGCLAAMAVGPLPKGLASGTWLESDRLLCGGELSFVSFSCLGIGIFTGSLCSGQSKCNQGLKLEQLLQLNLVNMRTIYLQHSQQMILSMNITSINSID